MSIEIHGFCDPRFDVMREAFAANFRDGYEIGASLALHQRGEPVVDLWAGHADTARTKPWEQDTIVGVASCTKLTVILSLLILIDRGQIELDRPVADYWPEFSQGGKQDVTVRDAMTHRGGVPGFAVPVSAALACDWQAVTARLAAEPNWFPGEKRLCYHAMTYGFLLGEIVRRVDGRMPSRFFREEVAQRIGADFQVGLESPVELGRMAHLMIPVNSFDGEGAFELLKAIEVPKQLSWDWLAMENPGGNGYGNGRSLSKIASILANGGETGGIRIVSPEIAIEAGREQAYAQCPYIGWLKVGLGLGLDSAEYPAPSPTARHWGGFGGSLFLADPANGISAGYAPNNWVAPPPGTNQIATDIDARLVRLWKALGDVLARA